MIKYVNISKVDDSMMITGIVAPPAAMVAKRSGQSVPQLSALKVIPDVIFVPTATILALIAVKVTKRMSIKKLNPL
jgi:type IV secretory pathway VirB2 component (pilin)